MDMNWLLLWDPPTFVTAFENTLGITANKLYGRYAVSIYTSHSKEITWGRSAWHVIDGPSVKIEKKSVDGKKLEHCCELDFVNLT